MATLLLRRIDGSTETLELSRRQPVTVGRQSFNDICVAEPDVAPIHCRISWNKQGFEVTAATPGGVEVNSSTVAHLTLHHGDTIRIGSHDLVYQDESGVAEESPGPGHHLPRRTKGKAEPVDKPFEKPFEKPVESRPPREKPVEDLSLFEGPVLTESQAVMEALQAQDLKEEFDTKHGASSKPKPRPGPMTARPVRPGEQEILKSPLVLGLAGGGLTLLLITGIFWFFLTREQSNRLYDRAVAEMNDGQYSQSISSFEKFIREYPNHGLRRQADRGLAKALIQKEISGAAPAWSRGLERLNELIKAHRNESDFSSLHSSLWARRRRRRRIAIRICSSSRKMLKIYWNGMPIRQPPPRGQSVELRSNVPKPWERLKSKRHSIWR